MITIIYLRVLMVVTLIGSMAFFIGHASAGVFVVIKQSTEVNKGKGSSVSPGKDFSFSFIAESYTYASLDSEYEYVLFLIVGEKDPIDELTLDIKPMYALLLKKAGSAIDNPPAQRIELQLKSPYSPGKYKVIYNRVPYFTEQPLSKEGKIGTAFLFPMTSKDPLNLKRRLMDMKGEFRQAATFTVDREQVDREQKGAVSELTLYLKVNGATPAIQPIKTGVVDRPLIFSWHVGPEFKLPKSNVTYQYQLFPDDKNWSDWASRDRVPYVFLPEGTHEFRVQAQYQGPEGKALSSIARFSFLLEEPMVAQSVKGIDIGPIVPLPVPDVKKVYSGSRALLIGISQFDDKNFPFLPADRIGRDITTLRAALEANGFQVATLLKPRVTKQDIADEIGKLITSSRENDRLFLYFSTHGFPDPDLSSKGYLAVSDCEYRNPSSRCIALGSLKDQLDAAIGRKVRQVVVAVDSCFSGLGVIVKSPPTSNLSDLAKQQGIYMLTAGMENQQARIDDDFKMSTFTYYLAKGLMGEAEIMNSNVVTLTELFLYTQYQVANRTSGAQIPMMGRIFGNGEMLFAPPTPQQARH